MKNVKEIIKTKNTMKNIIISTILIAMISCCPKNKIKKNDSYNLKLVELPWNVHVFIWQKHEYIAYLNSGLLHSESCKCKGGNK